MSTAPPRAPAYLPLRRVRPAALSGATAQTPGMARTEAISGRTVGAAQLWMGRTVAPAGRVSAVHHHAAGETAICVLRDRVTLFFGEGLREQLEVQAGEFLFVPAWAIHAEGSRSSEDAEAIIARSTPEAIAIDLPNLHIPEALLRPGAQRGRPHPLDQKRGLNGWVSRTTGA
jgi:uncharacterized RmlC-like cupin family protein